MCLWQLCSSFESFSTTSGPNKIMMILGDQLNLSSCFGVLGLLVACGCGGIRLEVRKGSEIPNLQLFQIRQLLAQLPAHFFGTCCLRAL